MVSDVSLASAANSQAQTQSSIVGLNSDFSQFLSLLTTQLQNQDPLSPMETNEFTNQLVAFSGVEQQINANQKLDDLVALNISTASSQALDYVGKAINYVSSEFDYDGIGSSKIRYSISEPAKSTTIRVLNEEGQEVFSTEGATFTGGHEFVWNGELNGGGFASAGTFQVTIDALDTSDEPIQTQTVVQGKVKGTETQNGQIFLLVGERAVSLGNVLNAEDATPADNVSDALTLALQYIGLDATFKNDKFIYTGAEATPLSYNLLDNADRAKIIIKDDVGKTIFTDDIDPNEGIGSYTWSGLTSDGQRARSGEYSISIDAIKQETTQVKDTSVRYDGETNIDINYTLQAQADNVYAEVRSSTGSLLYSQRLEDDTGTHTFTWDGHSDNGTPLPEGSYNIEIFTRSNTDTHVNSSTFTEGKITGVETENGHVLLNVDNAGNVALEDIIGVRNTQANTNPA